MINECNKHRAISVTECRKKSNVFPIIVWHCWSQNKLICNVCRDVLGLHFSTMCRIKLLLLFEEYKTLIDKKSFKL